MKKILLFLLVLFSHYDSHAQQTIFGYVVDEYDQAIAYAAVSQKGSEVYNSSSSDGSFHVLIQEQFGQKLIFKHPSYETLEFELNKDLNSPLRVSLKKKIDRNRYNRRPPKKLKPGSKQWHFEFGMDWMSIDFSSYEPELGEENIKVMNSQDLTFGMQLGFTNKRFYHGYMTGFSQTTNDQNDTITRVINKSIFGIQVGYKIIDNKRWSFMPNTGIKLFKYRLQNHDEDSKIPLTQFLNQRRDLDLRFKHIVGYIGGNLSYKVKSKNRKESNYGFWSFGIYGGYLFKIHPYPIIHSKHNRLTRKQKVSVNNINIGIHVTANIFNNSKPYKTLYQ